MTFQIQSKKTLFIAIVYLFAIMMQITAEGIVCFKCYASQPGHEKTDLLCSQFDKSLRFQVHCPSSTLCRKRTIYSKYKTSIITTVERDCAPQKRTVPIYSDNKWQNKEEIVTSAYKEGCFIEEHQLVHQNIVFVDIIYYYCLQLTYYYDTLPLSTY
ncbi:hypothetical protein E2986_08652 [Frieseomelitta varia]|uniref:Protein quiver n=1 Tax=Frieseomelitta varia TaxID=561572 RepID=A0A833W524_9HYME|nr:hypothetical protein E2986_08652 [Frieseomelitta varia]